jgi:hypothetical protein
VVPTGRKSTSSKKMSNVALTYPSSLLEINIGASGTSTTRTTDGRNGRNGRGRLATVARGVFRCCVVAFGGGGGEGAGARFVAGLLEVHGCGV